MKLAACSLIMVKIMFDNIQSVSRYVLPILALFILGFCLGALLRRKSQAPGTIQLFDVDSEEAYPITAGEILIGRHKNCDIVTDNPTVSRQHAIIFCSKDGWFIKNISASSSVKVNGNEIEGETLLTSGCKIQMGTLKLIFRSNIQ